MTKPQAVVFTLFLYLSACEKSDRVSNQTPWQPIAFHDTTVFSILCSENKLFVGTSSGLYLSTDQGHSWTTSSTGLTSFFVESLARDCTGIFYAATGDGIFRSTNAGASWAPSYATGPSAGQSYVAVSPANVIFASYQRKDSALLRSVDNGQTWTPLLWLTDGLRRISFLGDSIVFIANAQGQSYRSYDLGASWTQIPLVSEAMVPFKGALYAASLQNGLERSTDDGDTWSPTSCLIDSLGYVVFHINNRLVVSDYDGNLAISTENGWEKYSKGLHVPIWIIDMVRSSNDYLYAATGVGLFYKKFD